MYTRFLYTDCLYINATINEITHVLAFILHTWVQRHLLKKSEVVSYRDVIYLGNTRPHILMIVLSFWEIPKSQRSCAPHYPFFVDICAYLNKYLFSQSGMPDGTRFLLPSFSDDRRTPLLARWVSSHLRVFLYFEVWQCANNHGYVSEPMPALTSNSTMHLAYILQYDEVPITMVLFRS